MPRTIASSSRVSRTLPTLLNKLLQKNKHFQWSGECEEAFVSLKKAFCEVVTLAYPNFSKDFTVDTDASDFGIGAVISQLNENGVEQPIGYYSRSLSKAERKYAVTRKEMLALVEALHHFRCYLLGQKFRVERTTARCNGSEHSRILSAK